MAELIQIWGKEATTVLQGRAAGKMDLVLFKVVAQRQVSEISTGSGFPCNLRLPRDSQTVHVHVYGRWPWK